MGRSKTGFIEWVIGDEKDGERTRGRRRKGKGRVSRFVRRGKEQRKDNTNWRDPAPGKRVKCAAREGCHVLYGVGNEEKVRQSGASGEGAKEHKKQKNKGEVTFCTGSKGRHVTFYTGSQSRNVMFCAGSGG